MTVDLLEDDPVQFDWEGYRNHEGDEEFGTEIHMQSIQ